MSSEEYGEFSERIYEKAYAARVPTHGHFELTFKCALKCGFCYCSCYTDPEHTRRELGTREILRILDEAAAGGCLWMTFSGGDPFIRPDFREIYDHAIGLGLIPTIFCSGLLMTEEWLEHLKEYPPFKIEFPLYGVTAETYEAVAGKKNTFQTALKNLRRMLDAGLPVRLKSKMTTQNAQEAKALKDFVEQELGLTFNPNYYLYPRLDRSTDHLKHRLSPLQIRKFEQLYGEGGCDSSTESLVLSEGDDPRLFRCAAGINSFYINPYGELNFCTYVREASVDLRTTSIVEGVERLRKYLLARTQAQDSPCTSCSIRGSCQNCPGHAVLETGSMYGRSEYLCQTNQVMNGVTRK